MCGIAGVLLPQADRGAPPGRVLAAAGALAHRGPDGEGLFEGRGVVLAHRRLSVIDLSDAARQPMPNEDESVWVTFNGEIYNHRTLREGLEARGHRFRSRTDSEVLVHLYEERGEDLVKELRGMFAFAIWDARRERLVLARDRAGEKPLCYHVASDGSFWFASEAKALVAAGISDAIDPEAIGMYLKLEYVPTPWSAFSAIRRVPAAHRVIVERGKVPRIERYWSLSYRPKLKMDWNEAVEEVDRRILAATAERLESDVPLGAFLSGGVDSSTIVAMMARSSSQPIRTFTVGFDVGGFDERPFARRVAAHLGTRHEELEVEPPGPAMFDRMVGSYDDPFADVSAIPTMLLSAATRKHVTVAMTGDGGDESFAGYLHHRALQLVAMGLHLPAPLRRAMARLVGAGADGPVSGTLARRLGRGLRILALERPEQALRELVLHMSPSMQVDVISPDLYAAAFATPRETVFDDARIGDTLDRLLASDVSSYLADCLMTKVDIASMAVGLECRAPLLDHGLMEFAARLPSRWKTDGVRSKRILKRVAERWLPMDIVHRRKAGFSMPVETWLRRELRPVAEDLLGSPHPLVEPFVRIERVRMMLAEHLSGARTWRRPLWAILVLEAWLRARVARHASVEG